MKIEIFFNDNDASSVSLDNLTNSSTKNVHVDGVNSFK